MPRSPHQNIRVALALTRACKPGTLHNTAVAAVAIAAIAIAALAFPATAAATTVVVPTTRAAIIPTHVATADVATPQKTSERIS